MSYQQIQPTHFYNLGERLFRAGFYQLASANNGRLENFLVNLFAPGNGEGFCSKGYHPQKAKEAIDAYTVIGGKEAEHFVPTGDGLARMHMFIFRAEEFAKRLKELGAEWKHVEMGEEKKKIIAIISPEEKSEEWFKLEKAFAKLKWEKSLIPAEKGDVEGFITCENAECIHEKDRGKFLFFHTPSPSVSLCMMGRRIGFFLGCGQDFCIYDPPGVGFSTGIPSESLTYEAADTVYEAMQKKYDYKPSTIWLTGECGGNFAASYLKMKLHKEGVNFIHERGAWDLRQDFIAHLNCIVRQFVDVYWAGLYRRDGSHSHFPEVGFKIQELWKDLNYTSLGNIVAITIDNDEFLPEIETEKRLKLARSVNEHVQHIHFRSPKKSNPHFDQYFRYAIPRQEVLKAIFTA